MKLLMLSTQLASNGAQIKTGEGVFANGFWKFDVFNWLSLYEWKGWLLVYHFVKELLPLRRIISGKSVFSWKLIYLKLFIILNLWVSCRLAFKICQSLIDTLILQLLSCHLSNFILKVDKQFMRILLFTVVSEVWVAQKVIKIMRLCLSWAFIQLHQQIKESECNHTALVFLLEFDCIPQLPYISHVNRGACQALKQRIHVAGVADVWQTHCVVVVIWFIISDNHVLWINLRIKNIGETQVFRLLIFNSLSTVNVLGRGLLIRLTFDSISKFHKSIASCSSS